MFDEAVENNDYSQFIGGLDMGPLIYLGCMLKQQQPAERVEEIAGTMQSLIDEANK